MEELQSAVAPELDLIESRISTPLREFQAVLKTIRKTITKRDHKVCARPLYNYHSTDHAQLVDYDRFNNSLTKLRDKKEKSLSDEKNLFKVAALVNSPIKCGFLIMLFSCNKTTRSPQTTMTPSIRLSRLIYPGSSHSPRRLWTRCSTHSSTCSELYTPVVVV
jgi:hypothetical protein